MKLKFALFIFLLMLAFIIPATATEPDTIWTKAGKWGAYFLPDGRLVNEKYLGGNVFRVTFISPEDGSILQLIDSLDYDKHSPYKLIAPDSIHFAYYRDYEDSLIIGTLDSFKILNKIRNLAYAETIPFFDPKVYVEVKSFCFSNDSKYLFIVYQQNVDNSARTGIYKYNWLTSTVENKRFYTIDSAFYPLYELDRIYRIPNSNFILGLSQFRTSSSYDLFIISADSLSSRFNTDNSVHKFSDNEIEISKNGKYIIVSEPADLYIYEFTGDTLKYKNTLDITQYGASHFGNVNGFKISSDENYLVTCDTPYPPIDSSNIRIWNINNLQMIYQYPVMNYFVDTNVAKHTSIDLSPDDTKIFTASYSAYSLNKGGNIMLRARWTLSGIIKPEDELPTFISPNPTSDFIEIAVGANGRSPLQSEVRIYNVFGQDVSSTWAGLEPAPTIRIDVSGLAPGMYFVRIGDRVSKFIKI